MKLYADLKGRFVRQIIFDLCTLAWIATWVWVALHVRDRTQESKSGADNLQTGASDLSGRMTDAGDRLTHVPLVGHTLQEPFDAAAKAATKVSVAGHDMSGGIDQLGSLLGYLTGVTPIALALLIWALVRGRYARRAGKVKTLATSPAGTEVLALQALTNSSQRELETVSHDPVGAWKRGDADVVRRLAAVRLNSLGLRSAQQPAAAAPLPRVNS